MHVRAMCEADLKRVAELSEQLGYPTTESLVLARYRAINDERRNGLFVITDNSSASIVGWVHVYCVHLLESEPYAEIGGLVIKAEFRRKGAGRALMEVAEMWAQDHGYTNVRLRSGHHRSEAHQFYQRIGYEPVKSSVQFRKTF